MSAPFELSSVYSSFNLCLQETIDWLGTPTSVPPLVSSSVVGELGTPFCEGELDVAISRFLKKNKISLLKWICLIIKLSKGDF